MDLCRYDTIHMKGICLPDDAFKDRTAGQGGHIKLWSVVERVQGDLTAAEAGYKEDMANEQESFTESLSQLSSHVEKLSSYTDIDKVRHATTQAATCHQTSGLYARVTVQADLLHDKICLLYPITRLPGQEAIAAFNTHVGTTHVRVMN